MNMTQDPVPVYRAPKLSAMALPVKQTGRPRGRLTVQHDDKPSKLLPHDFDTFRWSIPLSVPNVTNGLCAIQQSVPLSVPRTSKGSQSAMHIAELLPAMANSIRKALQPPFDHLNYTQNTKARLQRRYRSLQKGTKFEGKNPTGPLSQQRPVTVPSQCSFSLLSCHSPSTVRERL